MKIYTPKLFEPFKVENPLGKCSVKIAQDKYYLKRYTIKLTSDKTKYKLGFEDLVFNPEDNEIIGEIIKTDFRYQYKYKIGEVISLASIIELLENKLNAIKIFAKNTAVLFHARYGFKSNADELQYIRESIRGLLNDQRPEAKKFKNDIQEKLLRDDFKGCTDILDKYFQELIKSNTNPINNPVSSSLFMNLTAKNVKDNANFYNKLFEKHQIDYKI